MPRQDLTFIDPPPPRNFDQRSPGRWQQVALDLAARPGEWALVENFTSRYASDYPYKALRKYGCQVTRRFDGEAVTLYAVHPGPDRSAGDHAPESVVG